MSSFSIARLPGIIFGSGSRERLPELVQAHGNHLLLVTGARSFANSPLAEPLLRSFAEHGIRVSQATVDGEPSPKLVDTLVNQYRAASVDCVLGLGGGSALDAAKAVAGLLRIDHSVMDFLEGAGPELDYPGPCVPLIAVPTTAGTGSEATKNSVLSRHGEAGFKKSFRDEQLVPEVALIDPDWLASCPPAVIAANGMDALTQLMEAYVSLRANVFTDALILDALVQVREGLLPWYHGTTHQVGRQGGAPSQARENMAYAALVSGIALAQTGLGSVHGLASPLGAFYPIPHGVVCGTLLADATQVNIQAMRVREPDNPALARYARIAERLCGRHFGDQAEAHEQLVSLLGRWVEELKLPRLGQYGLDSAGLEKVVRNARGSSMQTNPIVLTDGELSNLLAGRI